MSKITDLSPRAVKKALSGLDKELPKLSGQDAHDKLIDILVQAIYDRDGSGDFLWAHDLEIVQRIIKRKPAIKEIAADWFCGVPPKKRKKK